MPRAQRSEQEQWRRQGFKCDERKTVNEGTWTSEEWKIKSRTEGDMEKENGGKKSFTQTLRTRSERSEANLEKRKLNGKWEEGDWRVTSKWRKRSGRRRWGGGKDSSAGLRLCTERQKKKHASVQLKRLQREELLIMLMNPFGAGSCYRALNYWKLFHWSTFG